MKTFQEFITETISSQGRVNLLFEQGMYSLLDELYKIITVLREAKVPFEVIGGMAVNAHLMDAHQSRTFVTRDVDLLVNRDDLDSIVSAAQAAGYTAKKMLGGYVLMLPGQDIKEAVHLMFVGEKPRSSHPLPNPPLHPEEKHWSPLGLSFPVAQLKDLILMKLNSFRPKDEAHLEILDECGLITPEIVAGLPEVLKERLEQARKRYDEPGSV